MAKILFLMDYTTHIDKTELLNKKYNTNGISDFLNKEFERQKAENNSLVEVIDADFLEVLHNNYEADCFYSERLPEGVIGSYADFAKDLPERVFPVGRLDYNTEGLLLLTNDGDLAQKLTHPKHEVNKTYRVTVPGLVPQDKLDLLRIGVKLEDGMTAPAIVTLIGYDNEKSNTTFDIVIHEGRNRQVRRMCDFIGFPVRQLKRIKLGNLTLQGLKRGGYRILNEDEINALIKAAAINE